MLRTPHRRPMYSSATYAHHLMYSKTYYTALDEVCNNTRGLWPPMPCMPLILFCRWSIRPQRRPVDFSVLISHHGNAKETHGLPQILINKIREDCGLYSKVCNHTGGLGTPKPFVQINYVVYTIEEACGILCNIWSSHKHIEDLWTPKLITMQLMKCATMVYRRSMDSRAI